MNNVKNLGYMYDRWLIYKQSHQESGVCCFSFAYYLPKCVIQIYMYYMIQAQIVTFAKFSVLKILFHVTWELNCLKFVQLP